MVTLRLLARACPQRGDFAVGGEIGETLYCSDALGRQNVTRTYFSAAWSRPAASR